MDITVSELDEKIMAYTGEEKPIEYNSLMQKIYGRDNMMKCKWIEDHECKRESHKWRVYLLSSCKDT